MGEDANSNSHQYLFAYLNVNTHWYLVYFNTNRDAIIYPDSYIHV